MPFFFAFLCNQLSMDIRLDAIISYHIHPGRRETQDKMAFESTQNLSSEGD